MSKLVGILLVLSFLGLHQTDVFARRTPNQLEQFMKKRQQIKSGVLTYRFTIKQHDHSEHKSQIVRVRFFDVKQGPHNYIYTALIAEDTFGNVLIYDINNTYKFATSLKRQKVSPHKDFNHEEQYFYEPFAYYHRIFYSLAHDSSFQPTIKDSADGKSTFQIISSKKYSKNRFIFDAKTSLPIYHQQKYYNDKEYTLLDYQLNNLDSASFFRMLADSVKSLLVSCPNSPYADREFLYMPPLRDTAAPDFTFLSVTGDSIQLSKVVKQNKVVLLNFWFKEDLDYSERGKEAMRTLSSLYDRYKSRGLEILSLNEVDKKQETVDSVIAEYGIRYPVLFASNTAIKRYRINSSSCLFVINNGNIVYTYDRDSQNLEATISEVVKKYLK